jgi:hypothetical protein
MNTIQITTADGTVNYTESEILRFIEKAKGTDELNESISKSVHALRDMRRTVRDFFSEGEWNDGETVINKGDVNELLDSIGANRLTTRYNATYTITGTFTVEVEDEDDVESLFVDNVNVSFYDGDIDVDQVEVNDIEATE